MAKRQECRIVTLDARNFRQTMGLFATGVTVMAADVQGKVHGMTANAVTSLSLEPMLLLVCVGKQARMAGYLKGLSGFSINVLRDGQEALSRYFASAKEPADAPPHGFVPWQGGPRLEGCLAAIGCLLEEVLECGDHWIVIGRVVALYQGTEPPEPLLFF